MSDETYTVFRVTSFVPLTVELPDVADTVTGKVKVLLPDVNVTVKRLLSEVFDPRHEMPYIGGTLPGGGIEFDAGEEGIRVGDVVAFINASRKELAQMREIVQQQLDERGPLLAPVI